MSETSDPSTPPGSTTSSGSPGRDPEIAPDVEAGQAAMSAASDEETPTAGDETPDGGDPANRSKNTINNLR